MTKPNINISVNGLRESYPQTYKTKVLKSNVSFASQVTGHGYLYIIKWDFDLGGQTVAILPGNALLFEGGVLRNGAVRLYANNIWPNYNALTAGNISVLDYPAIGTIGYVDGAIKYCDGSSWKVVGEQELFYKEYTKQHNDGDFVYDGSVVKSNYDYYEVPVADLLNGEAASYRNLKYGFPACKAYFVKEGSATVYFKDMNMPYDMSGDRSTFVAKLGYNLYLISNSILSVPRDLRIAY